MSLTGNFDKLNKGNGGQETVPPDLSMDETENYATPSQTRNLCFVQPDGRRLFLNYAYLVSGEYLPEQNLINLVFTTHLVVLRGHNLSELFPSIAIQIPKQIIATDRRYAEIADQKDIVIHEIVITNLKI